MKFFICEFVDEHAQHLGEIFVASALSTAPGFYSYEQSKAWASCKRSTSEYKAKANDGRIVLVACALNKHPVAYAELERNGHIDHFYCHPDYQGQGIGKALIKNTISKAAELKLLSLHAEVSESAYQFFKNSGFLTESKIEFIISKIPMHNYKMNKSMGNY